MIGGEADSARTAAAGNFADSVKVTDAKTPVQEKTAYMEQIGRELNSVKTFDGSEFRGTKEMINAEVVLFGAWAQLIADAKKHDLSAAQKDSVARLRRRVAAVQESELPRMRAAWVRMLRDAMWEHDLDVRSSGRTLKLTSAIFASNAGVKKIREAVHEQAMLLRFRRVEYRWYPGADRYTSYEIESPADGAVRRITDSGFAAAD